MQISQRKERRNEQRYGISGVFGLPLPVELLQIIESLKDEISLDNSIDWYNKERLHCTILRGKSYTSQLTDRHKIIGNILDWLSKNSSQFTLSFNKIGISNEGNIRIYSEECVEFADSSILVEELNKLGYKLTISSKPWISFGGVSLKKPEDQAVFFASIAAQTNGLVSKIKPVVVDRLKLVYFEDIGFKNIEIIKQIKLS